jgi:hypothetical protein
MARFRANELHRIFECGNNQPRCWARIGAPRYVALALAAVLQDIPPWTPPQCRRASRMKSRPVKRLDLNRA